MSPPELATETVKLLAPALPALVLAGGKAVEKIGEAAGDAVVEGAKKIWGWLRPHAEKQPALFDAAQEVAAHPDDADAQGALRLQVRKLLEAHPQLVPELEGIVSQIHVAGKDNIVAGGDVQARDITISINDKKEIAVEERSILVRGSGNIVASGDIEAKEIHIHVHGPEYDDRGQQVPVQRKELIAMISSTAIDLPEHRRKAIDACLRAQVRPNAMEYLPAVGKDAVEVSVKMVDESDIYVVVLGFRYGTIPNGSDFSVTEIEYDRATKRGIPILGFLMDDDHDIKIKMVDLEPQAIAKLEAFKARIRKNHVKAGFKSADDLGYQILHALFNERLRLLKS
jgi:hypothetical protein